MENSTHPTCVSTAEAGERLGIPQRSVWGLIEGKWLPAYKFSGVWFVDRAGVEKVAKALDKPASATGGR